MKLGLFVSSVSGIVFTLLAPFFSFWFSDWRSERAHERRARYNKKRQDTEENLAGWYKNFLVDLLPVSHFWVEKSRICSVMQVNVGEIGLLSFLTIKLDLLEGYEAEILWRTGPEKDRVREVEREKWRVDDEASLRGSMRSLKEKLVGRYPGVLLVGSLMD